jgi:RNase H-like domain found in reverse transcriptase
MESLMGFVNYTRDYIPQYSTLIAPLQALKKSKKITKHEWGPEQARSFNILQKVLSAAPVLQEPLEDLPLRVGTDSSQYGVGAILYQLVNRKVRYIAFATKALNSSQKNYPATKRELLATMFALLRWRELLVGRKFILETDHKALTHLNRAKSHMLRDWAVNLQQFNMDIVHKPGFLNILPHHLSHLYDLIPSDAENGPNRRPQIAALSLSGVSTERVHTRLKEFITNLLDKKEPKT